MSYHIYTTDGIVLKRTGSGEADILLHILTHDLGLIMAGARSARLSVSKLRPALQEYSHSSISFIKGKAGWKITSATEKENFYFGYPEFSHKVLSRVTQLLLKMIPGESPQKEIFQIVEKGFKFIKLLAKEGVANFEILMVLRVLHELGYVENTQNILPFIESKYEWSDLILDRVAQNRRDIVSVINKALKESHL